MMNITIILPAVQVVRRDPESPQPTTPFPPVSITPSPLPYNPMTPFSPTEYKHLLEQYQQDESGQITKSQSDLAARQAAYDYENETFETPEPPPITKKSSLPRPLVRQKSIHPTTSVDNEEISTSESRTHTATESPSSADTVRTAIHLDSENDLMLQNETRTSVVNNDQEDLIQARTTHELEGHESPKTQNGTLQETEIKNETENLKTSTSNAEITEDNHINNEHEVIEEHIEESKTAETLVSEKNETLENLERSERAEPLPQILLDEVRNVKTEDQEMGIPLTEVITHKSEDLTENIEEKIEETVKQLEEDIIPDVHDLVETSQEEEKVDTDDIVVENLEASVIFPSPRALSELPEPTWAETQEANDIVETVQTPTNEANNTSENTQEPKISPEPTEENKTSSETTTQSPIHQINTQETPETDETGDIVSEKSPPLLQSENASDEANSLRNESVPQENIPEADASQQKIEDETPITVPENSNQNPPTHLPAIGGVKPDREKRKRSKEFRDPRKPAAYPQRTTKTTIARQALAREKRRVYVEERIQSYMRNSQQIGSQQQQQMSKSYFSQAQTRDDYEGQRETRDLDKDEEKEEKVSDSFHPGGLTNARPSNINPLQTSLPDINAYNYSFNPNMYTSSYEDRSPQTLSAISIIKHPPYSYSSSFAMAEANAHRSASDITSQETYESGSRSSGIYMDSNPEATSNYWKNISEQGFFYSFRVRQSGTVQMIDKGIQTGEQPQSYILDFSRKSDGSYYQKSSKPLPQTSTTHLPPINRDKILRDISETVQLRHDAELRRAELIQRANDLQAMVKEKREKINRRHEFWHKKYIEESSMTRPMEAACNSLRSELNTVHRRLIAHLEGRDLPLRLRDGPSKKANYKIMAARLQHEIKELQQKAKSAKLRLESEIKLKEQAEREVRDIRNDLAHKKVVMSLARSQIGGTLPSAHPRAYDSLVY